MHSSAFFIPITTHNSLSHRSYTLFPKLENSVILKMFSSVDLTYNSGKGPVYNANSLHVCTCMITMSINCAQAQQGSSQLAACCPQREWLTSTWSTACDTRQILYTTHWTVAGGRRE